MRRMTLLLAVCLCTASSFSALEIVESPSGALTVVRDGKTIIEDIAVNAGAVPGSEIRSSFELLPDGSKVWNRWCEACDRRYRLEVAQRSDGAVEITLAGQMEGSSRFRTRAVYLRSAPGVFIGKKFKGVVGNGRSWNPLEGKTGDALRKYGFRWFALEGLTFDLDPIGPTDYCMQYNQGVVQGVWTIIPEGGGLKFIGGTTVKTSFGGFVGAKVVIRKGSFEDYDRFHAMRSFQYAWHLKSRHHVAFASPKHGKAFADGDVPFAAERGYGWLGSPPRRPVVGAPSGV